MNIVSEGSEQDFLGEDISSSSEIEIIEIDDELERRMSQGGEEEIQRGDPQQEVPSSPEDTLKVRDAIFENIYHYNMSVTVMPIEQSFGWQRGIRKESSLMNDIQA